MQKKRKQPHAEGKGLHTLKITAILDCKNPTFDDVENEKHSVQTNIEASVSKHGMFHILSGLFQAIIKQKGYSEAVRLIGLCLADAAGFEKDTSKKK